VPGQRQGRRVDRIQARRPDRAALVWRGLLRGGAMGFDGPPGHLGTMENMQQPAQTERNRWIALYVLCTGVLMIVLDVTVVNVALPSIQDDLDFSQSSLPWVVNAYLISFGGLLLLSGRFGDLLGRRTVFLAGLFVFTVASLLCGLAQSQGVLVAGRFIQGIGGAMTSAVVLGMIVTMF